MTPPPRIGLVVSVKLSFEYKWISYTNTHHRHHPLLLRHSLHQAATHNQQSVEYVLAQMKRRNLAPQSSASGVYFGQLLGMADNLTFLLGASGYRAYKVRKNRDYEEARKAGKFVSRTICSCTILHQHMHLRIFVRIESVRFDVFLVLILLLLHFPILCAVRAIRASPGSDSVPAAPGPRKLGPPRLVQRRIRHAH